PAAADQRSLWRRELLPTPRARGQGSAEGARPPAAPLVPQASGGRRRIRARSADARGESGAGRRGAGAIAHAARDRAARAADRRSAGVLGTARLAGYWKRTLQRTAAGVRRLRLGSSRRTPKG